jgi:predicted nucleic acid-binding protein
MTSLIVDASVAVRWFVPAWYWPSTKTAVQGKLLLAPDLILAEAGSAFWKAVRAGLILRQDAESALERLPQAFDRLIPLTLLHHAAARISFELDHPIYDCFYLALCEQESQSLVTADKRLASAARNLSNFEVRLLGEQS